MRFESDLNQLREVHLPMNLTMNDITTYKIEGSQYSANEKFLKKTVIDALATSDKIGNNAPKKMSDAINKKFSGDHSVIVMEKNRLSNALLAYYKDDFARLSVND